jgi:hypothetical protein
MPAHRCRFHHSLSVHLFWSSCLLFSDRWDGCLYKQECGELWPVKRRSAKKIRAIFSGPDRTAIWHDYAGYLAAMSGGANFYAARPISVVLRLRVRWVSAMSFRPRSPASPPKPRMPIHPQLLWSRWFVPEGNVVSFAVAVLSVDVPVRPLPVLGWFPLCASAHPAHNSKVAAILFVDLISSSFTTRSKQQSICRQSGGPRFLKARHSIQLRLWTPYC